MGDDDHHGNLIGGKMLKTTALSEAFLKSAFTPLVLIRMAMVGSRMIQAVIQPSAIDWRPFLQAVDFS